MSKRYEIKRLEDACIPGENDWSQVPGIQIDCFPWDPNGYKPKTEAAVCYNHNGLYVRFKAFENEITIKHFQMNEAVYKDSCVEFFFRPEQDERYLNFEMNAVGNFLLGFGEARNSRSFLSGVDPSWFHIRSSVNKETYKAYKGPFWTVEYFIPVDFLKRQYGSFELQSGMKLYGNFYKCGDETRFPHYGCWNPILVEKPDFHLPQYFGELILE